VPDEQLIEAIDSLRCTFDLDGVTVLHRFGDEWSVEATVGNVVLEEPGAAPYSVEIASGRLLAMSGSRLTDKEATVLRTFLDQIRFARERAVLETIEG
jgi:hypothetical protein